MYIYAKDNSRIISCFSVYYYWIIFLIYLASVFFPSLRVGVLASILMLIFVFVLRLRASNRIGIDELVFLFAFYNIFSVSGYLYNGIPIVAFIQDFSNQLLPMIFFFLPSSKSFNKEKYYNLLLNSIIFCIIVGLYFYIKKPSYYFDYLSRIEIFFVKDYYLLYPRFNSFLGSTIMGSFSLIAMIISLYRVLRGQSHLFMYCLMYVISFFIAIITMQRSAMVLSIIIFFYSLLISIYSPNKSNKYLYFIYFLFGLLLAYNISKFDLSLLNVLNQRLSAVNDVVNSRSDQWINTISSSSNLIMGTGLGSVGHKALGYAKYVITDGSLFKIFAELGLIGFLLFGLIVFLCLKKAFKHVKFYIREIAIVFVFIIQSIGSNSLSFQQLLPIFWISLGIITFNQENSWGMPRGQSIKL